MADCELTVFGVPQSKGSLTAMILGKRVRVGSQTAVVNPRAVLVEHRRGPARKRYQQWRKDVERAARSWARDRREPPFDGPLRVGLTFYFERAKSTSRHQLYPTTSIDVDKSTRLILDALTGIVITNDARVIVLVAQKLYAPEGRPRVEIAIERMPATAQELRQLHLIEESA